MKTADPVSQGVTSPTPIRPHVASTSVLLLEGGDARIALDADGKENKYGCAPFPDPQLLSFGSSTASIISEPAFAAADRLRQKIVAATDGGAQALTYAHELHRVRSELKTLCGVDSMPNLDVVFAASGTDLHLIAAQLISGAQAAPTTVILVGAEETGSYVPAALAGKHFSTRSALGLLVEEDSYIGDSHAIGVANVALREPDGSVRPIKEIDDEVVSLAFEAAAHKRRVLLILVDVSKTGMIAPSPACALTLQKYYADSLQVLVDACQFRIAPATLRAYLAHDFMVALTGSKFLTGPTFSGALLLPAPVAQRLRSQPLPATLSAYSARADWPEDWDSADNLRCVANFGLLLRWEAALAELRAFRALPETEVAAFLQAFAEAITQRLQHDPVFEPVPVPQLDRRPLIDAPCWDRIQTIFPFRLVASLAGMETAPLSREQTMQVYRLLQTDTGDGVRCQLGQPVACGVQQGMPVSALRLCSSARLVVEALGQDGKGADAVIGRALAALDKTSALVGTRTYAR